MGWMGAKRILFLKKGIIESVALIRLVRVGGKGGGVEGRGYIGAQRRERVYQGTMVRVYNCHGTAPEHFVRFGVYYTFFGGFEGGLEGGTSGGLGEKG